MKCLRENNRFGILYVDDEEKSLKYFKYLFKKNVRIYTALNAREGYQILEENKDRIGIIMADQRMPGESGVQLLEKAGNLCPGILRILITAFSDINTATEAINKGALYKYITKPWDISELEAILMQGLEFFSLENEDDMLLQEEMPALQRRIIVDKLMGIGVLAADLDSHIKDSMTEIKSFIAMVPDKAEQEDIDLDKHITPDFRKKLYPKIKAEVDNISLLFSKLDEAFKKEEYVFSSTIYLSNFFSLLIEKMRPQFNQKGIKIENCIPDSLPSMKVDEEKFYRLFELFMEDEIVSLYEGGEVKITARLINKTGDEHSEIQIEIEDNGPITRQDFLQSVFDPFFIRKHNSDPFFFNRSANLENAGLNLIACFFIIYYHKGKIETKSEKGKGVVFIITIPTDPNLAKPEPNRLFFTAENAEE